MVTFITASGLIWGKLNFGVLVCLEFLEYISCNDHLHHLIRSLQDLVYSDVPKILLNRIVFQIPIATVHLESIVDNLEKKVVKLPSPK